MSKTNPRYANGALRRKHRARLKSMRPPCGICHGRLGAIRYDEPSDPQHPLSFVIDEKIPVSRWKEFGYSSARAAAEDWNNLQAAHYICNAVKGNKMTPTRGGGQFIRENNFEKKPPHPLGGTRCEKINYKKITIVDGDW